MNKELQFRLCDAILKATLGRDTNLVSQWWQSPNKAFDGRTPFELWEDDKEYLLVYRYLLGQMHGDYS
jgi:hypothetical protein